jgi:hypothetical protein
VKQNIKCVLLGTSSHCRGFTPDPVHLWCVRLLDISRPPLLRRDHDPTVIGPSSNDRTSGQNSFDLEVRSNKIALLGPFVQHIGASVFAPDIWLSETRNARYEHVSINDATKLLLLSFPRQR